MTTVAAATSTSATPPLTNARAAILAQFEQLFEDVDANHFYKKADMLKLLEPYNDKELRLIYADFCEIQEKIFNQVEHNQSYIVVAGGPASGKSTLLENILGLQNNLGENAGCPESLGTTLKRAYIDPDRTCLQEMTRTYVNDMYSGDSSEKAYTKWRNASNFLSNYFLAFALGNAYPIAHGSTMATKPSIAALQSISSKYDYNTTVVHLTCPQEVRRASEDKRREEGVFQCTDDDFRNKQATFLTMLDEYIPAADRVFFCYRGDMDTVIWAAKVELKVKTWELTIYNQEAFDLIKAEHENTLWEKTFAGMPITYAPTEVEQVTVTVSDDQ